MFAVVLIALALAAGNQVAQSGGFRAEWSTEVEVDEDAKPRRGGGSGGVQV